MYGVLLMIKPTLISIHNIFMSPIDTKVHDAAIINSLSAPSILQISLDFKVELRNKGSDGFALVILQHSLKPDIH